MSETEQPQLNYNDWLKVNYELNEVLARTICNSLVLHYFKQAHLRSVGICVIECGLYSLI